MAALDRSRLARAAAGVALPLALALAGCGGEIKVQKADESGAELFYERCSGCHSLKAANSYGSRDPGNVGAAGERTNGPNFDVRKESKDDILYAIRNGGFSGAIMPANIVVGREAEQVADFLEKYSGKQSAGG